MSQSSNTVRAAVIQTGSIYGDTPATLQRLERLLRKAAGKGAKLAVFPEALVGGYPKGSDFGAQLGQRAPEGRDRFADYHGSALTLPGPELDQLCGLAAELSMATVGGVIERDGGTLYCTSVYVDSDGTYLGKHRKTMPTAVERLIWGFGDGSTLSAHNSHVGVLGGAICWENYMPQLRLHQYAQGVELWCAPTVDDRDQWQHAMRHIAWEGRCFTLSACQFSERRDYPEDYVCTQGSDPETVMIRGGSVIVSPMGEVLAGPIYGEDAVLIADLDTRDIARGKFDLDVTGHYARPDLFTLLVNEERQSTTVRVSDSSDQSAANN